MHDALSESKIVSAVAEVAAKRITRRVIAELQRMHETLSGDDSGLKTTWDEICAQVQFEESYAWDVYDDTVRAIVGGYVADLPRHECEAIWLQTGAGSDWECDDPERRSAYPVRDDDIINYLIREHVYAEAAEWTNARIRAYIEQSSVRD